MKWYQDTTGIEQGNGMAIARVWTLEFSYQKQKSTNIEKLQQYTVQDTYGVCSITCTWNPKRKSNDEGGKDEAMKKFSPSTSQHRQRTTRSILNICYYIVTS